MVGETFAVVAVFMIFGVFAGAIWTFAVEIAGAPGAILDFYVEPIVERRRYSAETRNGVALGICVLGQSYAQLCWVAMVVSRTYDYIATEKGLIGWPLWIASFLVCYVPTYFTIKPMGDMANSTQTRAHPYSAAVIVLGFWEFAGYPPSMQWAWSWLPFVG